MKFKHNIQDAIAGTVLLDIYVAYGNFKRVLMRMLPGRVVPVPIGSLRCHVKGVGWQKIKQSPHYQGLYDMSIYTKYLKKFGMAAGYPVHTNSKAFTRLLGMNYLAGKYRRHHVLVAKRRNEHYIFDGIHRSAILTARANIDLDGTTITVKLVPWWLVRLAGHPPVQN